MNRTNWLAKVLFGTLILSYGCTKTNKLNTRLPFAIQISGPFSNDTILREGNIKEIFQRFKIKILNNNKLEALNFESYDDNNNQIIPYTVSHVKKATDSLNKVAIQEIWKTSQCIIKPNSSVEKKMNIVFFPDYDTIHFEFKFSFGEELEEPVRVSYLIQNGALVKRTNMKFRIRKKD